MHKPRVDARLAAMIARLWGIPPSGRITWVDEKSTSVRTVMAVWMKVPVPLRRAGYRLAYRVLRVYWFVWRPRVSGVKCVLTRGEDVLLVRHTYGSRDWDLPGGTLKRREDPVLAARREMQEELGVVIEDWRDLGAVRSRVDRRRDTMHCYQSDVSDAVLTPDPGEIEAVRWFARGQLPDRMNRYARNILALAP